MRRRWTPGSRRRRRVETVEPAERTTVVEERVPAPPPRERLWPWLLALLLIVLAGLGSYWLLTREDEPDKTAVPRLVGMREPTARAALANAELQADVDRRPSRRPRGVVFAQTPGSGTQVAKGTRVELLVSSGPAGVAVPRVVGLREAAAGTRLGAAGLKTRVRRAFAKQPRGVVVDQEPQPGTRVVKGTAIEIAVSRGPRIVVVPEVTGQDQRDAVAALRRVDLLANIVQVPAPDPRGTVVAQNPRGGQQVQAGTSVRLNVSTGAAETATTTRTTTTPAGRGASVRVPTVTGQRQTPALRALENAGLRGRVVYVTSTQPQGTVVSQRPAAGATAARGSSVQLGVSSGPASIRTASVPDVVGQDQQTATQTLRQSGFRVEVIGRAVTDPAQEGLVVDQQPAGGSRAPQGSTVTIFVGEAA